MACADCRFLAMYPHTRLVFWCAKKGCDMDADDDGNPIPVCGEGEKDGAD